MNSYITIVLAICGCVALSTAQYGYFGGGFSDGYLGTNFGVPSYGGLSAAGSRDPRANRGPVLFPPSPPNGPPQTSGVIPGASGYGFVPPGSQGPALPRYFYQRGFYL
ncbi:unnamed protein product [Parnassius apollo]|uniref:(apollo) hypothetical protein n=1 Tax=Parnassius apollo TaxID=110799 RepID=A0A8S3WPU7_PARAO|nr:unnamed protein product [Parnassius apollo]